MDKKKVLAGVLILILLMLLFRSSKSKTATASKTVTTTKVVNNHPYYHSSIRNNIRHQPFNPYKAQYYN